jgi:outer membrane protein assembly factor BamB
MRTVSIAMMVLLLAAAAPAQDAVGWRTDGNGVYAKAEPTLEWSATKNVLWKTPMPSWGNASPALLKDRLFVCAEPATLLCVKLEDGKIMWKKDNSFEAMVKPEEQAQAAKDAQKAKQLSGQIRGTQRQMGKLYRALRKKKDDAALKKQVEDLKKKVAEMQKEFASVSAYWVPPTHGVNGYSTCTPVTDGKNVFVVFGTGTVAAYDIDGERKWIKVLDKPTQRNGWGHSCSPVLVGDKLIVHITDLVALDTKTGEEKWRTPSRISWGSLTATKVGGLDVVITPSGDIVRVEDGKRVAKSVGSLSYCAPILNDGNVYFVQPGGRAAKLEPGPGKTVKATKLWSVGLKRDRYYGSPVLHEGLIYTITRAGYMSVIDAKDGKVVWQKQLTFAGKGYAYPSITLGGKHIFVGHDSGEMIVFEPGREPKEIARNKLDTFRSCPVFAGKRMYLRTYKALYCIGK